ncbi:MAG: hypothetical protein ABI591_04880 [Kofleriaceae bacterium]
MSRLLLLTITVLASCAATTAATIPTQVDSVTTLAGRRAELIGWLHDYRVAGVYPADASGNPASVFVDANGVRCPMAELVHKTGRDDLVEAVRQEGNGARLADVHTGPLHDWMLASGLTQEEIAMVQGAMTIDFNGGRRDWTVVIEQAEVRGQLEMAEAALRQATAASLAIVARRLPTPNVIALASSPIKGHVLPEPHAATTIARGNSAR